MKSRNVFFQITVAICDWRETLRSDGSFREFYPGKARRIPTKEFATQAAAMKYLPKLGDVRDPRIERLELKPPCRTWENVTVWPVQPLAPLFDHAYCQHCGAEVSLENSGHHDNARCKP